MRSIRLAAVAAMVAVALAACSSGKPSANKSPTPVPALGGGPSASPTLPPTPAASATGTGAPTTVDPCQLVTPDEASHLTGVSYTSGKLEVDSAASRRCIYGAQTKHVFEVIFVQGSSPDEAKAYADQLRAQAEGELGSQVDMSQLSGIGDDAEQLHANKAGIDMSGLYIRKSSYGLALVDEALGTAATLAALKDQAQTSLGRLP